MKRLVLVFLFLSSTSFASTWMLECAGEGYNGKTDMFEAIVDSDKKLVSFRTSSNRYPYKSREVGVSTDLGAIDPGFHEAKISHDLKIVEAKVGTYNYFRGEVKMYLGKGLVEITKDVDFSIVDDNAVSSRIAVEYNDGDGFDVDKRSYTCNITRY